MHRRNSSLERQQRQIWFVSNTCASLAWMAAGFAKTLHPQSAFDFRFRSAAPNNYVHPFAILVMLEMGIEINQLEARDLKEWGCIESWEIIYLDTDKKNFPFVLKDKEFTFWAIEPPIVLDLKGFEWIRDQIEISIRLFFPNFLDSLK